MEKMRRFEREILLPEIKSVIADCHVVHIGLNDSPFPYVVPTNYGYEWRDETLILYSHGARQGKKRRLIAADPHVCIQIDDGSTLMPAGEQAPDYSAAYRSVIGFGIAELIADPAEKRHALDLLMQHETGRPLASFAPLADHQVAGVGVIKITLTELTGKAHTA
ncbi:pyridoxamine 5'-phosphate oxidase family protein [Lacticaseibacillus baoqingensis]|uniref:Pyridoxamine 5'-phosphate oxidase family protein n=1 Tax=Lacticaseibacillus baoqingensis TaxID=2486013 RepID=A0ABW4E5D3_9LACO|nr:pyridoxamine 5'-phosphate oxidase family protein [Lacticaseibacillus baoqingensis]